jgi:hypothetical protein
VDHRIIPRTAEQRRKILLFACASEHFGAGHALSSNDPRRVGSFSVSVISFGMLVDGIGAAADGFLVVAILAATAPAANGDRKLRRVDGSFFNPCASVANPLFAFPTPATSCA